MDGAPDHDLGPSTDPGPVEWVLAPEVAAEAREAAVAYLRRQWRGIDPEDHQDLAQEAVLAVNALLARGEELRSPVGWVVHFVALRANNVRRDRERFVDASPDRGSDRDRRDDLDAVRPSRVVLNYLERTAPVSRGAIAREQMGRLAAALDEDELRLVWLVEQGFTHAEIGELMELQPDSVKKRLARLRARIRADVDRLGVDDRPGDHPRLY